MAVVGLTGEPTNWLTTILALRPFDCAQCVGPTIKEFDDFCKPKQGCGVYLSSCTVRYKIYDFSPPLMLRLRKFQAKLWKVDVEAMSSDEQNKLII